MKAQVKLYLLKMADPRLVRVVLFGLMLAFALLSHGSVVHADPCGGTSGCGGG